jgi:methionyl-tRNA formyltransferase
MTKKGYTALQALVNEGYSSIIDSVVLSRDLSIKKDYYDELVSLCTINNIRWTDDKKNFSIDAEYSIAVSWRWMLKPMNSKLIVLHDSILPKYRGFSPLINMLINGEEKIGVTAIFAANEYDTGSIIDQRSIDVNYPIKIFDVITKLSSLYADLVVKIVEKIDSGSSIESYPQIEKDATYSLWRNSDDYRIDWTQTSEYIKRFIDSVGFPFNGATSMIDNNIITIYDATLLPDLNVENRDVGKVIFIREGFPVVVCGSGLLKITEIKDGDNTLIPFTKIRTIFK